MESDGPLLQEKSATVTLNARRLGKNVVNGCKVEMETDVRKKRGASATLD
jgi:hypothetical protein